MGKKDRMGSGLDLLFEDNFADERQGGGQVSELRISMIEPDRSQPRKNFDEKQLAELADNIAQHGVLQPILVRPIGDGIYRIVAGERRWRAARKAGLTEIPAVVRELDDKQAAQISLIENIQRSDLDPIEEAAALRRLMDEFGMTQEQLAKSIGRSRSAVANSLRLLTLDDRVKEMLSEGKLTAGHAKLLLTFDTDVQHQLAEAAVSEEMSVRGFEKYIDDYRSRSSKTYTLDEVLKEVAGKPDLSELSDPFSRYRVETEAAFREVYGIDARVRKERRGGYSLKLNFGSEKELKELVARISEKMG